MADDSEWLFESIIQFLRCPLWTGPVQTFIDENCLCFSGNDENALELTSVHSKFRELVDSILQNQLSEMGIPPEQFITACEKGKNKELNSLVSEYILSLDDFQTFKKMMEKRNVELELEALSSLSEGARHGKAHSSAAAALAPVSASTSAADDEEAMFRMALSASVQEDEILAKQLEMEEAQLAHALAMSLALEEERLRKAESEAAELAKVDKQKAQAVKQKAEKEHKENVESIQKSFKAEEQALKASTPSKPLASLSSGPTQTPTLGAVQMHRLNPFQSKPALPSIHSSGSAAKPAPAASTSAPAPSRTSTQPTSEDIEKRKVAMKAARDQLLAAKKSQRQKDLEEWEKQQAAKSAAAPAAETAKPKVELDDKQREMRLALGRRFKEDLMEEARKAASQQ